MSLATVTVDFDVNQILGGTVDARRVKCRVYTNVVNQTLMDTSTGEVRMGNQKVTVNTDGTGEFTTWAPGADGNPISWQTYVEFDYPRAGLANGKRIFGPYTIDTTQSLALYEEEQAVPAEYLTTVTALLDGYVTDAQTAETNAEAAQAAAEAARDDAVDISGISTSDGVVEALVKNTGGAGPLTSAALSDTIVNREQTAAAAALELLKVTYDAGGAPFQIQANDFPNTGGGTGTRNKTLHMGYNASLHSSGPGEVAGQIGWMVGFESNYWAPETSKFGPEFYVEYWSPDHTTQQMRRPFYARLNGIGNADPFDADVRIDVGDGSFAVGDGPTPLFVVSSGANLVAVDAGQFNISSAAVNITPAASAQAIVTIDSPNPVFRFRTAGAALWAITPNATTFTVADSASRAHMVLEYGATAATALSTFNSKLVAPQGTVTTTLSGSTGANNDLYISPGSAAGQTIITAGAGVNALQINAAGDLITRSGGWIAATGSGGLNIGNNSSAKIAFWGGTTAARPTGWAKATGTATRSTFDTATVTTAQLAERFKAFIDDYYSDARGLFGA